MSWPALELASWQQTYATLHRCLQIVGKVQLALTPRTNHFWNVAFGLTAYGLVTPPLRCNGCVFTVEMDFVDHNLLVRTNDGKLRALAFLPRTVAEFYQEWRALLASLDVHVAIWDHPVELQSEAIPFTADQQHAAYDTHAVERWWAIVSESAQILECFRARFQGKCSPVQFYWGSFDLVVSRFSGRVAAAPPSADPIQREAYSHEVSSVGFWPGDVRYPAPAYFAYTFPKPDGLEDARVAPHGAFWHAQLGEFILPYDAVREAPLPDEALLAFCQSTYEAGAEGAGWDRASLERHDLASARSG